MVEKFKVIKTATLFLSVMLMLFMAIGCDNSGTPSGCGNSGNNGNNNSGQAPSSGMGPYTTTENLSSGPEGASGLWYPTNTPANVKLPIYLWGCGGGSKPSAYVDHMNQIASYGFVAIAEVSTGNGTELTAALEWLIAQNKNSRSPLYQKLDTSKVAAGGHSMGSVSTFAIAADPRLTTTIQVAGGSLDGNGGGTKNLRNPTAIICGADDAMGATDNAEVDFQKATVPVFFGVMAGVGHIDAARSGLAAQISWLRWHLKGETALQKEFLDPNGAFQTGMWDSQIKNW